VAHRPLRGAQPGDEPGDADADGDEDDEKGVRGAQQAASCATRRAHLTSGRARSHPTAVGRLITAAIVALQMLGTPLAGALGCGGWRPAPEARMACCDKAMACPMRGHRTSPAPASRLSQAEADACCATAESGDAPPLVAFALPPLVATFPAFPIAASAPVAHAYPPDDSPPPGPAIPRHLLLTVILI
jgi:hypothetical protein